MHNKDQVRNPSLYPNLRAITMVPLLAIVFVSLAAVAQSPGASPNAASIPNRALITVDSHAGPWLVPLNPNYDYGIHDNDGPAIVDKANSGIDFVPGKVLTIIYISGLVSAGADFGWPYADANGYVNDTWGCGDGLRDHGTSGTAFPCVYTDTGKNTYLIELMGVFADSNGVIVGKPFGIGDGPY